MDNSNQVILPKAQTLPAETSQHEQHLTDPIHMISTGVVSGQITPEVLKMLMELRAKMSTEIAERKFNHDFSVFQSQMPDIVPKENAKYLEVDYWYCTLAELTNALLPVMTANGLSISYSIRTKTQDGSIPWVYVEGTLWHTGGAKRTVSLGAPMEYGKIKTGVQKSGAVQTTLKRQALTALTGAAVAKDPEDMEVDDFEKLHENSPNQEGQTQGSGLIQGKLPISQEDLSQLREKAATNPEKLPGMLKWVDDNCFLSDGQRKELEAIAAGAVK